jgi:hypothetical protein
MNNKINISNDNSTITIMQRWIFMNEKIYPEACEIGETYHSIIHNYKFKVIMLEKKKVFELLNEPGNYADSLDTNLFSRTVK